MNVRYEESSDVKDAEFMKNGLRNYNADKCDYFSKGKHIIGEDFGFYAYEGGRKVGGIYGHITRENWGHILEFFIDETHRNKGVGTKLIRLAEDFVKGRKCAGIMTETWDFQAPKFYEKNGFEIYGVLHDHPIGAIDYFLKKRF